MGFTSDLLTGLAEHLANAGIGLTWRPTGVYTAGETGILLQTVPPTPDRVVVLTPYPVTAGARSDVVQGVQVRCRATPGSPTPVLDLDDAIYNVLHGAENLHLGPVVVAHAWRASATPLGPDQNRRHETSSNYYLTTAHPSAHVTD
ncbi:minor capsid protein [Oerskovia sp. NPDC060338]|uniref:minor capsid protein n=1 Tax=Oerskovia sp. NPDC060338 TaxID=3347100 RepID=UPI003655E215